MRMPLLGVRGQWIGAALLLAVGLYLFQWNQNFSGRLDQLREDYELNLEISEHESEYRRVYDALLREGSLPKGKRLEQNAWIQKIQTEMSSHQMVLRELSPRKGRQLFMEH